MDFRQRIRQLILLPLSGLLLVSGVPYEVALHYCKGSLVDTRITLTGKSASCGMERENARPASEKPVVSPVCCTDTIVAYESVLSPAGVPDGVVCAQLALPHFIWLSTHLTHSYDSAEIFFSGSPPSHFFLPSPSHSFLRVFLI